MLGRLISKCFVITISVIFSGATVCKGFSFLRLNFWASNEHFRFQHWRSDSNKAGLKRYSLSAAQLNEMRWFIKTISCQQLLSRSLDSRINISAALIQTHTHAQPEGSMNVDRFNPVLVLHISSASAIVRKRFHSLTTYRTTLNLKSRRADNKGPNNTSLRLRQLGKSRMLHKPAMEDAHLRSPFTSQPD